MMEIAHVEPKPNWILFVTTKDGRQGEFDLAPYLEYPAFQMLKNPAMFNQIENGGYFVEWTCGADLSADTIEARWKVTECQAT